MSIYLESRIICIKDGGDGFSVGEVYELLEVDGVYCAENNEGCRVEAFRGKTNACAGNSHFDYYTE